MYSLAYLVDDDELSVDLRSVSAHSDPQVRIAVYMVASQKSDSVDLSDTLVTGMCGAEQEPEVLDVFLSVQAAVLAEAQSATGGAVVEGMH